ncbi:MAG: dihydrodipicolinate synthase family protein [Acidobacteriota bacterium]|nr:dihydrodipicolinate synthase family protein [Acidobacteriota bacterium]
MSVTLKLPTVSGALEPYQVRGVRRDWPKPAEPISSRIAYSAAHVVCDPLANVDPTTQLAIDWDATLGYRHHLWSYGLAVAEAMDTAQRGMGLDWVASQELIRRSLAEAKAVGGIIACGAGTDHLAPAESVTLEQVEHAYREQCAFIEGHGGRVILMASRALARAARMPDDYLRVYCSILRQVERPVILHWLGEMFDPALRGYWGSANTDAAMDVCLSLIREYEAKIDGIKISLLDADQEIEMRRRLPAGVKMYTGDDFNYDRLIIGDEHGFSHALLGIFDAIAPAASCALQALDVGDTATFNLILAPTVPLSRHIFQAPTYSYKTGIVFLAYLNNHQSHFRMIGGKESARSVAHLAELFRLADVAGLLIDTDLATERMARVLAVAGIT